MSDPLDKYQLPDAGPIQHTHRIMVVGVGGGGSNAVNHMFNQHVESIEFVNINTDLQALRMSPVSMRILIGPNTTGGRGAGAKPELARAAAEESIEEIRALFDPEPNMVFITAGMGGGTGTGASPVVAKVAKELGILTVGIVTIPFMFEGLPKIRKALAGADELGKYVDALLVINNERLTEIYPNLRMEEAFAKADDTLTVAARSISEIVTTPGMINLDFRDVDTTLRDGKTAIISVGYGEGENRVTKAIQDALNSPLLRDSDIYSSKRLLFSLYYSPDMEPPYLATESKEITNFIQKLNLDLEVIWGMGMDPTLGNQVRFTILASGFDITVNETGDMTIPGNSTDAPRVETQAKANDPGKDKDIERYYGTDKIGEMHRQKEIQKYIILNPDDMDSDEVIDRLERTPAFLRDKRTGSTQPGIAAPKAEEAPRKPNVINFSDSDL